MDHCHTADLISLEQALDNMLSRVTPLDDTEAVALTDAAGRITATPVISPLWAGHSSLKGAPANALPATGSGALALRSARRTA